MPDFDREDDKLSIQEQEDTMSSEEWVKVDENTRYHTTVEKIEEDFSKKTLGQQNIIEEGEDEEDKNTDVIF